ncbi:dihydroxyacetone kinase phosphotransfer subunit [Gracilibacillus halotolerans]|uniref:phosphoenolpyruvate--glycerone phosphotransferase n=1 Tax=Gracilibacillus halotolerans TaxID=74386 RepID=A0A841RDY3_9BACI|nr:dihydroxyacetone kinase phosphoryl donor subunit DhaM [Gracilibacillus halotolerans]MBB6512200.1 dihydroxyacetone kinase phosphotransfer subunit [Gracilibacillus halotolerans]
MNAKVGIVIISHSLKIGEGVKELAGQVIQDVPIEVAAGTTENEIGTSIEKIQAAIEKANKGAGALLMYDLGSAKMNAEMAIEFANNQDVKIAEGIPLVEGAYIAAVESNMGHSLAEILLSLEKIQLENM